MAKTKQKAKRNKLSRSYLNRQKKSNSATHPVQLQQANLISQAEYFPCFSHPFTLPLAFAYSFIAYLITFIYIESIDYYNSIMARNRGKRRTNNNNNQQRNSDQQNKKQQEEREKQEQIKREQRILTNTFKLTINFWPCKCMSFSNCEFKEM